MIVKTECSNCDGEVTVEISGRYYSATLEEPASYPEFELVSRACVTGQEDDHDPEDACDLTDAQVLDNAEERINSSAAEGPDWDD